MNSTLRRKHPVTALAACLLLVTAPLTACQAQEPESNIGAAIDAAMDGDHRSDRNKARNQYRRPKETLEFFGLRSDMTVVEYSPGGGWYPLNQLRGGGWAPQFGVVSSKI